MKTIAISKLWCIHDRTAIYINSERKSFISHVHHSYLHIDIEPVPKNGIATSRLASLTVRCRPTAVRPAEQKRPHVASCTTTSRALSLLEAH